MEQYIDKSALEAKIRKRLLPTIRDKHYDEWEEGQDSERIAILDILDTLEVKEVNLEKEIDDYVNVNFSECGDGVLISDANSMELTLLDITPLAKHFFELGMAVNIKAQKGE